MTYLDNIKNSLDILLLKKQAIIDSAESSKATVYGILTLIIAGIASAIPTLRISNLILQPISMIIGFFILYSLFYIVSTYIFKGKSTFTEYIRPTSNSAVIYWAALISFIPYIGFIIQVITSLWLMIVNVIILRELNDLSLAKAIITTIIGIIVVLGVTYSLAIMLITTDPTRLL